MPTIKAQAVMANSIAVTHYVSQVRVGKQSELRVVSHIESIQEASSRTLTYFSADGGISRGSCQVRATHARSLVPLVKARDFGMTD